MMNGSAATSTATGRVAVVTGAASGMGLTVSRLLASQGHRVAMFDLQGDAVRHASKDLAAAGGSVLGCEVDVTDRGAVDEALRTVRAEFGPVEIMITCAGLADFTPVTEITPQQWDRMLAVNLNGTFNCIQPVVPDMLAAGWGRIVTISSVSAQAGAPNMAHYTAAKGGVIGLTKGLAYELAPHGITVNTIPPSVIDTPMSKRGEASGGMPSTQDAGAFMPVKRAGTPEEIAATCVFLCSDDAGFITGQSIGVNGGFYM